jgi:DNA-binding response OmpR family regulator
MQNSRASIVMVDDDALMRRSLSFLLTQAGYDVTACDAAEAALAHVDSNPVDLVLLDIGLPGMDGLEALRRLQAIGDLPVIFVTARRRELEQVLGLELGADDYITKPFDPDVLLARVRAVLRRSRRVDAQPPNGDERHLQCGDITIDSAAHVVTRNGAPLELSPREFDLLHVLAREPERVLSVDDLLDRVWGPDFAGEPQIVYVHIRRLREKIEEDPASPTRIVTIRGVGYRLLPHDLAGE